jgi:hypothetical protein
VLHIDVPIASNVAELYLSNLYLRASGPSKDPKGFSYMLEFYPEVGRFWCKDITFEGAFQPPNGPFWSGIVLANTGLTQTARLHCDGADTTAITCSQLLLGSFSGLPLPDTPAKRLWYGCPGF